jgi:hypothetical protein
VLRALIVIALAAFASTAHAHQTSVKYVDIAATDGAIDVTVKCAPGDVTEAMKLAADATPSVAEATAHRDVPAFVLLWFAIAGCAPKAPSVRAADASFIEVTWTAACERTDQLALDLTRFFALDQRHEAVVRLTAPGRSPIQTIVRASEPTITLRPGEAPSLLAWVWTGMHHIYGGTDHVLFVISLLVVVMLFRPGGTGGDWSLRGFVLTLRSAALVISAFTIAHSITLIAAALGYVALSSRFVEAVIAVSIVYTAVEDIVKPDVRWRFFLTFAFGLIHGLGFAGTLAELLPPSDVVVPLLCFNAGVEIGQLTIVAVVLPLLYLVARVMGAARYRRYALPVVASAIALVGLEMLIARIS